jgi:uncharacterized protein
MKEIFVDTGHLIAVINPGDQLHEIATLVETDLGGARRVTSEFVFIELLNYFCNFPKHFKRQISIVVDTLTGDSNYEIIESSHLSFQDGFDLYRSRLDHGYSLTDCISMNIMRERQISDILTNDDHFTHEGFHILL